MAAKIIKLPVPEQPKPKKRMTPRKDKLYQKHFHYRDKSGASQEHTVYGKTQDEANQNKANFLADVKAGLRVDKTVMTVDQLIKDFKAGYKDTVKGKTYKQKCIDLEDISGAIGGKRVREIETSDIKAIMSLRAGMAKTYIHKLWVSVNQLFNFAVDDHIISYSPCPRKMALPLGTEKPHRELEQWERDLIFKNWQEHWFGIAAMCMLFGSCRPGESIALTDKDIDLDKNMITIDEAISFPDSNQPVLGDPKTKAGKRNVEIFPPLHDALQIYMEGRKPGLLIEKRSGGMMTYSGFRRGWQSFIGFLGRQHNGCYKRWAEHKKIVWKDVDFDPYDLRHTFCTMCFDAGVDMKTTAEWMGHGDEEVTYKIYTHLSRIRKQASTASMSTYLTEHYKTTGSITGSKSENSETETPPNP